MMPEKRIPAPTVARCPLAGHTCTIVLSHPMRKASPFILAILEEELADWKVCQATDTSLTLHRFVLLTMYKPNEQIPALVASNLDALRRQCALLESQDQPSQSLAQSYLARFKVWAGSLGAHRTSGPHSLEYRLRDASSVRKHLISLLQELKDMVVEEGQYLTPQNKLRQWCH